MLDLSSLRSDAWGIARVTATLFAAVVLCALALAVTATESKAAATLNVSADPAAAGALTELTINTELTGSSSETEQYGAEITVPSTLRIDTGTYGAPTEMCPVTTFSEAETGVDPGATAFTPTGCPSKAKIGTASLGSATGSIYFVESSPLPHMGVYFSSGVSTPYGRKIELSYPGSSQTRLTVNGLGQVSTSGLTLTFNNPSRPTLSPKIWRFVAGTNGYCEPESSFSGSVLTWPVFPSATAEAESVAQTMNMTGCGSGFSAVASNPNAGQATPLKINVTLDGTGQDTRMFGTEVTLPPSLVVPVNTSTLGNYSQMCDLSAYTYAEEEFPVGFYTEGFDNSGCPAESIVGTAELGSMTGTIHVVESSPIPNFGVYFDGGVDEPFGLKLDVGYRTTGNAMLGQSVTRPVITVFGLPDVSTNGLELDFNNPTRPSGLASAIWKFQPASHKSCGPGYPSNILTNWLSSGTEVGVSAHHSSYMPLNGCT